MSEETLNYKLLPPPVHLPKYAENQLKNISYFGQTNFASGLYQSRDMFGIKRIDRRRHVYVLGKSGMGKSCLLEHLIRFDIAAGHGVGVIDPHGDLAKGLINFIPKGRMNDVVYVDPGDFEHPIAFNPFACVPVDLRQTITQGLIEIFKKQFAATWTPRIEHLFRFATLATLEDPEGTLYGFLRLLTDAHYRQRVLKFVTDDVVKRFFAVEFASFSQKYDQEAITPLTNRLGQFFADPLMRAIFTQKENKIDFADIMNNGKILLVNASKGSLGEENSALFGAFFLTKLNQTAMARSRVAEADRREFYLYVDEFQNVATQTFESLFSESRKYAVNITVANQYLAQIPLYLQEAIFGNVGTLIVFRVGGSDSQRIAQEFLPLVEPHDFINLGLREFYIKMSIDGKTAMPFSATTIDLPRAKTDDTARRVIELCREKYGRKPEETDVVEDLGTGEDAPAMDPTSLEDSSSPADMDDLPPPV